MKTLKKFLTLVLCISTLLIMTSVTAFAADEYTYTVTISAGNQGTFKNAPDGGTVSADGKKITITGLKSGDTVTYNYSSGVSCDSKYYAKGIRMSGRDNSSVAEADSGVFSTTVESNADYVVAYGIDGTKIKYTVTYKDANGNQLADPQEFWCNVGDKPIVAYKYIEGYRPQAYNLTRTITGEGMEIPFVYTTSATTSTRTVQDANTVVNNTTIVGNTTTTDNGTTTQAGTAVNGTAAAGTTADNGTATADGTTTDGTTTDGTATDGTTADDTTEIEDEEVPQDLVDLDEEETPTSNVQLDDDSTTTATSSVNKGLIAGLAVAVAAVAVLLGMLVVAKKKN